MPKFKSPENLNDASLESAKDTKAEVHPKAKPKSRAALLLAKTASKEVLPGPKVLSYGATGLVLGVYEADRIIYAEGERKGEAIYQGPLF